MEPLGAQPIIKNNENYFFKVETQTQKIHGIALKTNEATALNILKAKGQNQTTAMHWQVS